MNLTTPQTPIILTIDTSTHLCSVAIARGTQLLAEEIDDQGGRRHASLLPLQIDSVLLNAHLKLNAVNAVCHSQGPGSYTGLRVGLSTAKGICMALDIPLIGVSTLQGLAYAVRHPEVGDVIVAMIDAGRDEVYQAVFDHQYRILSPSSPMVISSQSFDQLLQLGQRVYLVGDAVPKVKKVLDQRQGFEFDTDKVLASYFVIPALNKFIDGKFENLAYSSPEYLKTPTYRKSI